MSGLDCIECGGYIDIQRWSEPGLCSACRDREEAAFQEQMDEVNEAFERREAACRRVPR